MDKPIPIKLPPGFFRNGTEYESAGRWFDGNLVRWENGRMKPWGGWRRVLSDNGFLTGIPRGGIAWVSNIGYRYAAIGTHSNLYVSSGGAYGEVTPNDLVVGRPDGIEGPGYGAGPYGAESYGTQRTDAAVVLDAATWSFDTYGEDLLAVLTSDGRVLRWQPSIGGDAVALAGAPTNNAAVLCTDEQHILVLGAGGNRRRIQWNKQGDVVSWTPGALSTAGSRILKTNGRLLAGRLFNSQPIVWTTTDVHAGSYLGPPLVYEFHRISETGGLVGPNAVTGNEAELCWMSLGSFKTYDGVVRDLPCEVQDYVFGSAGPGFNTLQRAKVFAAHNSRFKEMIWFYPSAGSTENDRYVVRNYGHSPDIWYFGELQRTTWIDRGVFVLPIAADASGVLWEHDYGGFLADGVTRSNVFAQSGPAEIGDGERVIYSNLLIPDATNGAAIRMLMKTRTAPQGAEQSYGPFALVGNSEGYVGARFCGRQVSQRIEQILDQDWSIGRTRVIAAGGGRR